jgi:hypothetical protein
VLNTEDFADGRMRQVIADLTQPGAFNEFKSLLEGADLFFIDAAKDGICEPKLIEHLANSNLKRNARGA